MKVSLVTSGWSYRDWVGNFYPKGTKSGDFLSHYAKQFSAVEIPGTYYAIPAEKMVRGWDANTPEGFTFLPKMPQSIVHGGDGPRPDPKRLMHLDHVGDELSIFLERIRLLGPKLGPILVQLPYFNKACFPGFAEFMARAVPFLEALPTDLTFALEIRNKTFIQKDLLDFLRGRSIAYCVADQEWMPPGLEVVQRHEVNTAPHAYLRLIGERERIDKLLEDKPEGQKWQQEVIDRDKDLDPWVEILRILDQWRVPVTYVICNNHYGGHAPTTVQQLRAKLAAAGL